MKEFAPLRAKTYTYLKDNNGDDKKAKVKKKCSIKKRLDFKIIKTLQKQLRKRKITYLEKNKFDVDSLKEDQKEFVKNNKVILKTQQRLKIERHNSFTEEISKIALSSNDDKKMWSINLTQTYAFGMSKHLIFKKEKI